MQRNYTNICRVCMAEGSRDIFPRNLTDSSTLGATAAGDGRPTAAPSATCSTSTSPLDRLLEKLRYVTMMKIDENDDLPRLLCDLCIVQLNVAYNFKRQAVENDTKLRQYFIENGISSSHYNVAPTVSTIRTTTRGTLVATPIPTHQHIGSRHIPVIPFVVKSEATETDRLSDITETHLEIVGNGPAETQLNHSNNTNSSGSHSVNMQTSFGASSEVGTNSSMVYMINGSSGTPSSEVEFIPNPPPSARSTVLNRKNLANNEESSFIQRLKMGGPSKSSEQRSNFQDESTPQQKKQKLQPSSIDLDIKERMLEAPELRRLAIDSNFQPSDAPRQARALKTPGLGTTHATQTEKETNFVDKETSIPSRQNCTKTSEKKGKPKVDCSFNKTSKSMKLTNAPHKTDSHKMLPNPFTPKITTSEKLLQKIKTVRGKRPPEKLFRPKINPPTTKKLNKATSTK